MQPGAGLQRHSQRSDGLVVGLGVGHGVGGAGEHQQHAVGLVDLAPAPHGQQVAGDAVVPGPHGGHGGVAQLL